MRTTKAKRCILAFLVLCAFVFTAQVTIATESVKVEKSSKSAAWVAKKSARMYEKKSIDSKVLTKVPKGSAVSLLNTSGAWCKVLYNGVTGFVRKASLKKTESQDGEEVEVVRRAYDLDKLAEHGIYGETVQDVDDSGLTQLDRSKNKISNWSGRVAIGDGGMAIPQLYQFDYKDPVCVYNGAPRSVATSGCGVTSLSMVISYLTGNMEQSPYTLFREACQDGMYSGNGLSHSVLTKLAKRYGVLGEWKNLDEKEIKELLNSGVPIIVNMGKGYFTKEGHYIVLRGVSQDGRILVNDPASAKNSALSYSVKLFTDEKRKGHSFMVVTKLETTSEENKNTNISIVPSVVSNDMVVKDTKDVIPEVVGADNAE